MEIYRKLRGDKTPNIGDSAFESRLREIRKRNGGNIGVFFVNAYEVEHPWVDKKTGFNLQPGEDGEPMGKVFLIFQEREEFLRRYHHLPQ